MRKLTKCLSLLLLCCLLFTCMPRVRAASYATLELVTSYSGSECTVTVKLTGNKRPRMIEFCLEYDSAKLKLKSKKAGSAFSSSNAPTFSNPKTGRVLFAWESLTGLKDGKLLVLTFTAKSGAKGSAEVWFNEDYNTVFMDGDMKDIPVKLYDTDIDLDRNSRDDDDDDDDDDDESYTPRRTVEPYDPYDADDDDDGYWEDEPDASADPFAEPTPLPWEEEPESTPIPVGEDDVTYTMADMTIYVGQECPTQEGFLFLSSNSKIVLIENGQLRGVSAGSATITAYKDGAAVGSCTITVQADPAHKAESASSGGGNVLRIVLWSGIALILASVILILCILVKRNRE